MLDLPVTTPFPRERARRTISQREGGTTGRSSHADAELLASLYGELRARAGQALRGRRDLSLQPTALVNEACLKLLGSPAFADVDRSHCLALASKAMRSLLVDHARSRGRRLARPGEPAPLDELHAAYQERSGDLVALDAALAKLEGIDPVMARAVDLHFFGGLSLTETARALDVPLRTLERRWQATRTWLKAEVLREG